MISLETLLTRAHITHENIPALYAHRTISGIRADSRYIEPFDIFVSIPCPMAIDYIQDVIEKGCKIIIAESEIVDHPLFKMHDVYVIAVSNPRLALAKLAAAFYDKTPQYNVAITGTNGKSSTVHYVRQFWEGAHKQAASLGTLGVTLSSTAKDIDHQIESLIQGTSLTTLDSIRLHQLMQLLKEHQIDYLAFEASSHGLDQYRIHGVPLHAAAFTNLTQDHLDYHKTMHAYFHAKAQLFSEVLPPGHHAILNADSPYYTDMRAVCEDRQHQIITYSRDDNNPHNATIWAKNIRIHGQAQMFDLVYADVIYPRLHIPVSGDFQIENILAALGLVLSTGLSIDACIPTLAQLTCATGRLECVGSKNDTYFYVDYAHTPDALEKALINLRPFTKGRLWVVFGCGGNRDTTKRPIMGRIAAQHADVCIVTDDNPRFEDPEDIRAAIMETCSGAMEIGNRREAIAHAIHNARPGDIVLIAGKGHETGQIIGNTTFPFDDRIEIMQRLV